MFEKDLEKNVTIFRLNNIKFEVLSWIENPRVASSILAPATSIKLSSQ